MQYSKNYLCWCVLNVCQVICFYHQTNHFCTYLIVPQYKHGTFPPIYLSMFFNSNLVCLFLVSHFTRVARASYAERLLVSLTITVSTVCFPCRTQLSSICPIESVILVYRVHLRTGQWSNHRAQNPIQHTT